MADLLPALGRRASIQRPSRVSARRDWRCAGARPKAMPRRVGEIGRVLEMDVREGLEELWRSLLRERLVRPRGVGSGGEGVGAVFEHALRQVCGVGVGLNAQVAEHGVRFPAADEFDDVGFDPGAEEGRGAAGPEAACAEESGVDACLGAEQRSGVAERIGDEGRFYEAGGVRRVVVGVDRSGGASAVQAEVMSETVECFARANAGVGVGLVSDLLATDGVLLVSEGQRSMGDAGDFDVIQERVGGAVDTAVGREVDVT